MRNPFGSEAAAFRLVLFAALALGLVAAGAALDGAVLAVPAAAVVAAVVVAVVLRPRRPRRVLRTAPARSGSAQERRALLLLQEEEPAEELLAALAARADRVLVASAPVVPALGLWLSDVDGAREQAGHRVEAAVSRLQGLGVEAAGAVGDEDPLQALEDALRSFEVDELAVSTSPGPRGERLVERVRERFALPVTHLVA